MSDLEKVLFANDAFYQAFSNQDLDAMEKLWSQSFPVCCLHPGWGPIFDRKSIMTSWAAILTNPGSPEIKCRDTKVYLYGDVASVICFEEFPGATLITTNIFHREGKIWKIIHHQAGPTSAAPNHAPKGGKFRQLH